MEVQRREAGASGKQIKPSLMGWRHSSVGKHVPQSKDKAPGSAPASKPKEKKKEKDQKPTPSIMREEASWLYRDEKSFQQEAGIPDGEQPELRGTEAG